MFLQESDTDARDTVKKLPKKYRKLLRGYQFKFQNSNTLDHDDENIGKVQGNKITVAAPWFYPKEFTFLHEIGHVVWEKMIKGTSLEKQWKSLLKNTKNKVKQNDEEIFCHSFSAAYSTNPPLKHYHKNLINFIKNL